MSRQASSTLEHKEACVSDTHMTNTDALRLLIAQGWHEVARKGSHVQLKKPHRYGRKRFRIRKRTFPSAPSRASSVRPACASSTSKATTVISYIGLIRKDSDSDFGVDFSGCISAGTTLEEARGMAQQALELHVHGMAEDGDVLPVPSSLDAIMADPDNGDAAAFLATLPVTAERSVRVNTTLPEPLLRRIDACARNRSAFLARAAEKALSGS